MTVWRLISRPASLAFFHCTRLYTLYARILGIRSFVNDLVLVGLSFEGNSYLYRGPSRQISIVEAARPPLHYQLVAVVLSTLVHRRIYNQLRSKVHYYSGFRLRAERLEEQIMSDRTAAAPRVQEPRHGHSHSHPTPEFRKFCHLEPNCLCWLLQMRHVSTQLHTFMPP